MSIVRTTLRGTVESARRERFEPSPSIPQTNVQKAIEQAAAQDPVLPKTNISALQSPYSPTATDTLILVDTSAGAVTINLAAASSRNGIPLNIKDKSGNASTNNITINAVVSENIDGLASYNIKTNFAAIRLIPNASVGYMLDTGINTTNITGSAPITVSGVANGNWNIGFSGRVVAPLTSLAFYIDPVSGVDTATRDGQSPATAWQTRQFAWNTVYRAYDFNMVQITFQCQNGTFTDTLTINGTGLGQTYFPQVIWRGNILTPTQCIIKPNAGSGLNAAHAFQLLNYASVQIEGFYFDMSNANSDAITLSRSQLSLGNVVFGPNHNHNIQPSIDSYVQFYHSHQVNKGAWAKTVGTTNGSTTVTCTDTSNLEVNQGVHYPGVFPDSTYITAINPNVSVTVSDAALSTNASLSVTFTGYGLTHIQCDPGAFVYSGTSDGGANQICTEVLNVPRFINGCITLDRATASMTRHYFVQGLVETTGNFSVGGSTANVNVITGITVGKKILHPKIPLGATVATVTPGSGVTGSFTWTGGAATANSFSNNDLITLCDTYDGSLIAKGPSISLYNASKLDCRRTYGGAVDNSVVPGHGLDVSVSFNKGDSVLNVGASAIAQINRMMSQGSNYRGLLITGPGIAGGTAIAASADVGATTMVRITRPTTSAQTGVTVRISGFAWDYSILTGTEPFERTKPNYTRNKLITATRDLSAADGTVVYTIEELFVCREMLITGTINGTNTDTIIGLVSSNGTGACLYQPNNGTISQNNTALVFATAGGTVTGNVTLSEGSFSIVWSHTGTPTGIVTLNCMCME